MRNKVRIILNVGLAALAVVLVFSRPPIAQDPAYHAFADSAALWGIPNFWNVVSNLPFLVIGGMGLVFLKGQWNSRKPTAFKDKLEIIPWAVLFLGVALTGFGSAYYHWAPDNLALAWDRLPMTLVFMALFAALIAERVSVKWGLGLLPVLLILGILSVWYWRITELQGNGDLRLYILVQYYPVLAIPLLYYLFPARYSRTTDMAGVVGFYLSAKLLEFYDGDILGWTGFLSGHTLKHLAAAAAVFWLLRHLRERKPANS